MVNRDIILAKIIHIQKSLERLQAKKEISLENFIKDQDAQDIVLFNLQTAIQGCIDIASHIVSDNNWGVPENLGGLFDILNGKKIISDKTKKIMFINLYGFNL